MNMKNYWERLKNDFLYSGISREEYHLIRNKVRNKNLRVWQVLTIAEIIIFLICYITTFHNSTVQTNKIIYLIMFLLSTLICIILWLFREWLPKVVIDILISFSECMLIIYGMILGLVSNPDLPSTTFMVMLVITPMLIIGRPWVSLLMILITSASYTIAVIMVKEGTSQSLDIYNTIIFAIVAIILHFFTSITKMRGLLADYKLERLTTYDGLTGLENELAYVMEVEKINKSIQAGSQEDFAVLMGDVNGVKPTNDTYGHQFGCALIVEGGHYMGSLFSTSRVFHFGGDEYIVILQGKDYLNREALLKQFEEKMDDYFIDKDGIHLRVSIAFGVSCYQKGSDKEFAAVMQRADDAMYLKKKEMKAKYHIASRKEEN